MARSNERHSTSGGKSDPGDAAVLADLARADRHHHRRVAGDSGLAEVIKLLSRGSTPPLPNRVGVSRRSLSALAVVIGRCRRSGTTSCDRSTVVRVPCFELLYDLRQAAYVDVSSTHRTGVPKSVIPGGRQAIGHDWLKSCNVVTCWNKPEPSRLLRTP